MSRHLRDWSVVLLVVLIGAVPAARQLRGSGADQVGSGQCSAERRTGDGDRLVYAPNRPDAVLRAKVAAPIVGLGIDDGPDAVWTPQVLDVLARHQTRATFFVVGEAARLHPALVRRISDAGHEVALHTYDHRPVERRDPDDVSDDIAATVDAVRASGVEPARLFRPPHGLQDLVGAEVVCREGLRTIGWTINVNELTDKRLAAVTPGAIVLAHDGRRDRSLDVAELDRLLDHLAGRGLRAVTIGELLVASGVR